MIEVIVLTSLEVRQIYGDEFSYEKIPDMFTKKEIGEYKQWVSKGFGKVCNKNMTIELNSEWVTRHYLAVKMILSATVMITSLEYAIEKNLMISVPYLSYYAILSCCRAIVFTLPSQKWGRNLIEMKHAKILNTVGDCVRKLNVNYGNEISSLLFQYKDYRELFSYKFPASGVSLVSGFEYNDTVQRCKTLCEIAQLNSQQVERYIEKHCFDNIEEWGELNLEYLKCCFQYPLDDKASTIIDIEDAYRVGYINRKQPFPVDLYHTASQGMVEDYFGSWCSDENALENKNDKYNPDCDWNRIFQFL